jgi:hypothetical protein
MMRTIWSPRRRGERRHGSAERLDRLRFQQARCMRDATVSPCEREHPLVRTHKQLDRMLSEIKAYPS